MTQHYFSIALDLKEEWFKNAKEGNLDNMKNIYKIMKEKGLEEDIKDWRGSFDYTILMEATRRGRPNVVRWLLHELKFDVNEQQSHGFTGLYFTGLSNGFCLHVAALYNRMECARLLLDAGAQHLKNTSGQTPLDCAKTEEMQELLVSHFHFSLNCDYYFD